jgi:hypothetical protein
MIAFRESYGAHRTDNSLDSLESGDVFEHKRTEITLRSQLTTSEHPSVSDTGTHLSGLVRNLRTDSNVDRTILNSLFQ